jgi:hypothetical protein
LKVFLLLGFNREIDEKTLKNHSNSLFFFLSKGKRSKLWKEILKYPHKMFVFLNKNSGEGFHNLASNLCKMCSLPNPVNIHIMHKDNKTWNNIYGEPTENGYPRLGDAHLYHRTIASLGIL